MNMMYAKKQGGGGVLSSGGRNDSQAEVSSLGGNDLQKVLSIESLTKPNEPPRKVQVAINKRKAHGTLKKENSTVNSLNQSSQPAVKLNSSTNREKQSQINLNKSIVRNNNAALAINSGSSGQAIGETGPGTNITSDAQNSTARSFKKQYPLYQPEQTFVSSSDNDYPNDLLKQINTTITSGGKDLLQSDSRAFLNSGGSSY